MIAANLPDIDVLVFATDTPSVSFRRGWTHGVLAQALLPVALTAMMVLIERLRTPRKQAAQPQIDLLWTLALAYIGLYSHVALDYLNNYGVRLLSPLDWRWFYGDAVFIVDPWLWASLGIGVWLARRRLRPAPARVALVIAASYIAMMVASAQAARHFVIDSWRQIHGTAPAALMVGPLPVVPFAREVIVDAGDHYVTGRFSWPPAALQLGATIPKHHDEPEVARAREAVNVHGFLVWSRFPYWQVQPVPSGTRVTVHDMRFGDRFAASTVVAK
jgi:inner membrane protein